MSSSVTLAVLGGKRSGKTSFISYFTENAFDENEAPTTKINVVQFNYTFQGKDTRLSFLDIASNSISDHFKPTDVLQNYLKYCLGAVIIIDLTDPQSLSTIQEYLTIIKENMKVSLGTYLVCSKSDLRNKRRISQEQLNAASQKYGLHYIEASFKLKIFNMKKFTQFLDTFGNRYLLQSSEIHFTDDTKKYEVDHSRFKILNINQTIGSGAFANVYKAEDTETHQIVAMKVFLLDGVKYQYIDVLRREIALLCKLNNTFVIKTIGFTRQNPFYIVTDLVPNGNLFTHLHKHNQSKPLTSTQRTIIAMGIAYGMKYVHDQNIIHRDLKSNNILIDENDYPVICDFGIAKIDNNVNSTDCLAGTIQWMAPEIMNRVTYGKKVDVYSYGMILFELLTNAVPFQYGPLQKASQDEFIISVGLKKTRPALPSCTPLGMSNLIKSCWSHSPNERPTFEEIFRKFATHEAAFDKSNPREIDLFLDYIKEKNPNDTFLQSIKTNIKVNEDEINSPFKLPNIDINSSNQSIKSVETESTNTNEEQKKKSSKKKKVKRSKSVTVKQNDSKMHRSKSIDQEKKKRLLSKSTSMTFLSESDDDDLGHSSLTSFDKLRLFEKNTIYETKLGNICDQLTKDTCFYFYYTINKIFRQYYKQWKQEGRAEESKKIEAITEDEISNLHSLLRILISVISKPHFFQRFIFANCLTYLPFYSSDFIEESIEILTFCIKKNPNCLNENFAKLFNRMFTLFPDLKLPIFEMYITYFESISNPWPFLDLIVLNLSALASDLTPEDENDNNDQMYLVGKYINILFQLCKYYPNYRNNRLFMCTKAIMKTLSFLYEQAAKDAYHFLTFFFNEDFYNKKRSPYIKLNFMAISIHLKNMEIDPIASSAALAFVVLLDQINCGVDKLSNIIGGLILHARTNPTASQVLIDKIASSKHGKMLLVSNPAILLRPLPTFETTFTIFTKIYEKSNNKKNNFQSFEKVLPAMFTDFLQAEEKVALPILSTFICSEKLNAQFVKSLEESDFPLLLLSICKKQASNEVDLNDQISVIQKSFSIIKHFADYEYLKSYLKYVNLVVKCYPAAYIMKKMFLEFLLDLCKKHKSCTSHLKNHHIEFVNNILSKHFQDDDTSLSSLKRSISKLVEQAK